MKKITLVIIWSIVIGCITLFSSRQNLYASDDIEQIKQAINAKGAKWTAGENWVTQLSPEQRKQLLGAVLEPVDPSMAELLSIPMVDSLPSQLDWRDNNGNWVTPPRNQGGCGSCWAFSAVGQVEAWWKIYNHELDSMIDLSEQFILSCGDAGSCDGGSHALALEFVRTTGIPTESCFAYEADDEIPCNQACDNWEQEAITIPGWGYITLDEDIIENIKNAVYRHPVSASYDVYTDFFSYSGGVYEHVWGDYEGGHAILIVGWNDEEQSWICKNSWGPNWGDHGYFRIKWSNCGIGRNMPFIWDETITEPAIVISPNKLDISLTVGDSVNEQFTIANVSTGNLEYYTMDYSLVVGTMFHPDVFNAYDNMSWWCGDPQLGGYDNRWLQYLDTPILDLSNTSDPLLSWKGFWAIEDSVGAIAPYDGWDGCNVWISTDGGSNFEVAYPMSPAYTCQSLWSFGHPEQGWDMGEGIPGWVGRSGGWIPILFDLSPFKSDSVVIRFAFASDQGLCTRNDGGLTGFFVDEILIVDGVTTLFENQGNEIGDMQPIGFIDREVADWFEISNGSGYIGPYQNHDVQLEIITKNLNPGKHIGQIYISSNDTTQPLSSLQLNLELQAPAHDVSIEQVWLPGESIPILFPVELGAKIQNRGLSEESNFYVACNISSGELVIYGDTVLVQNMSPGSSEIIKFDLFLALAPANLNVEISLLNLTDDYNAYNNIKRSTSEVTNLVDGFETETGFWDLKDGWIVTDKFGAFNGNSCARVNSGPTYSNNMDAIMTFTPGFDLTSVDNATLKFWTRCITEANKDICYIEASGDSLNWTKLDSLSGTAFTTWTQREVGLIEFINAGFEKVWVRFHFVSDDNSVFLGVFIDDVEIYPEGPTAIAQNESNEPMPSEWRLSQNYPNPFNLNTKIAYSVPEQGDVKIIIYNVRGEIVRNLLNSSVNAGLHVINWDGLDNDGNVVGSGIYLYQIKIKGVFSEMKKMILLK